MRLLQKKSRIGDFHHVVIHSSIIRPAANEFIQEYLKRLHTGVWEPIHPLLNDVLNETFGIMVYQEDVSRVAVHMAGFSHVEADALRKIMSKKDKEHILKEYYGRFEAGARARGVAPGDIKEVWRMITSFSGYSFCKPHSASYARVSFQAAYLKTHFPAEFMAAVISNQGGFYATFAYVSESRRLHLEILPPDIIQSDIAWKGQGRTLRVGLMAIKALSAVTMAAILRERSIRPFSDLDDFFSRVRPHENEARALILAGALDCFAPGHSRSALLWAFSAFSARRKKTETIFMGIPEKTSPVRLSFPALPPENELDRLRREFSVLGFLCSCHPMVLYAPVLNGRNIIKGCDLPKHIGNRVRFAGWLLTGKVVRTKLGDPMEFLTFEDETAIIETVFFPKVYLRFCHLLNHGRPYLLTGTVESDWGAVTLSVEGVKLMDVTRL